MARPLMICALISLVAIAAYGFNQPEGVKDEIEKLAKTYDAAILTSDAAALNKLYDDDGIFVEGDGGVLDKKGYSAGIVERKWESVQTKNQKVRAISDSVAVESGEFMGTGKEDGKPFRDHVQYLAMWVKKQGVWKIVAEQNTPILEGKK